MKTIRVGYSVSETMETGSRKDGYGGSEPEDTFEVHKIRHIDLAVEDGFRCNPDAIKKLIEGINENYELKYDEYWELSHLQRKDKPGYFDTIQHIPAYEDIISWVNFRIIETDNKRNKTWKRRACGYYSA